MRPCLLSSCFFLLSACAQSPVVDFIEDVPDREDPELPEPEPPTPEREGEEPPADDGDDVQVQTDPLTVDAGSSSGGDAGAPADASSSAGADAGRDAGVRRPSLIPGLPALPDLPAAIGSLSPPRARACTKSADCTVSCFPLGAVACCRADKVCGCSWAPGAYCL